MSNKTKNQSSETNNTQKLNALKKHKGKKIKKVIKTVIIVLIILGIVAFAAYKMGFFIDEAVNPEQQLTTYKVSRRTITEIIESTGTIAPNAEYKVTPLVSGEILEDYFEEGENVFEDQPLYLIDSESGDSRITQLTHSVEKSMNALKQAQESIADLSIESTVSGTVEKIHFEIGDTIKAGDKLADIIDKNVMVVEIPFFDIDVSSGAIKVGDSATVYLGEDKLVNAVVKSIAPTSNPNAFNASVRNITFEVKNNGAITKGTYAEFASVNNITSTSGGVFDYNDSGSIYSTGSGDIDTIHVREGQRVSKGDYFVTLANDKLNDSLSELENSVIDATNALNDAKDELDNYKIKAPKTGKIVTKSYKTGDTVSGNMNGGTTLAVIYDMSALKFTMNIDELDIDKLNLGQEVIITCDSRKGQTYSGNITNISILGSTSNGTTSYPVEVTIENVEDPSKRVVNKDGTINKTYKTGMTSTVNTYKLISKSHSEEGTTYNYNGGISVLQKLTGELLIGDAELKGNDGSYVVRDTYYTFGENFAELTVEEQNTKGMLRIAMNVDAQIVVAKHENVIAVPQTAVSRGDIVKVIKNPEALNNENKVETEKTGSETPAPAFKNEYSTAPLETEYTETIVTTGASDDNYIEITSGLNEGDVVIVETSKGSGGILMQMMGNMHGGEMVGGAPMAGGGMGSMGSMGGGMRSGSMGR